MTEELAMQNLNCLYPFLGEEYKQAIDKAVESFEKQIPKKPIYKEKKSVVHCSYSDGSGGFEEHYYTDYFCPCCDWVVGERYNHPHFKTGYHVQRKSNFCNQCGQAIDWSESEKLSRPETAEI